LQGSRVMLIEIQSLVGYSTYAQPKRMVNGLDYNRVNQIAAILERRVGLSLSKQDIYASVVGGLNVNDPAVDLAICLSIVSCSRNILPKRKLITLGEIGLTGELRAVSRVEQRLKEAAKLGFEKAIIPISKSKKKKLSIPGLEIIEASKVAEVLAYAFN
ncbi:MAG TPA: magnesium chelatase domain-containing protein, partial [Vampirovibrionales bacterium]